MRLTMTTNVKPSMPKTYNVREFTKLVKDYSQSNIIDKSIVGNLSSELTIKKFDWSQPSQYHVIEIVNLVAKLNSRKMELSESFSV
uniref:Uncharacterized protein n=1 Tax=Cajanus cajan TaxID=3821 RepID=A0A151QYR0_CAJCA|nr:hypothetical protein KK1_043579 [Cajanus cajan]